MCPPLRIGLAVLVGLWALDRLLLRVYAYRLGVRSGSSPAQGSKVSSVPEAQCAWRENG